MSESSLRLPRGWALAAYLDHLPSILGLVVASALYLVGPGVWPGAAALWVLGPLLAIRLLDPWYELATVRFAVHDDAITLTSGLFTRRTRSARWREVRAVDVVVPWSYRLLGLARVTVAQAGQEDTRIVLPAVDRATRERILELSAPHLAERRERPTSDAAAAPRPADLDPEREPLFRATVPQLLLASLVLGQFAVAGAAAFAALFEIVDSVGLTEAALGAVSAGPLLIGAACGVLLVATGGALTVARYWGFEVAEDCDGTLLIRFGLLARVERRIDATSIVGITMRRNLIELLLGRARLGLLTTDSAAQLGTNLLLPSLPVETVDAVLRRVLPDEAPILPTRRASAALRATMIMVTTIAPAAALLVVMVLAAAPLWLALGLAIVVLLTCHAVGRLLCSRLSFDEDRGTVALLTRHASEQHRVVRASATQLVTGTRVLGRPLLARTHFYAGAPRSLTAVRFDTEEVARLRTAVARGSRQALQQRLARRRSRKP